MLAIIMVIVASRTMLWKGHRYKIMTGHKGGVAGGGLVACVLFNVLHIRIRFYIQSTIDTVVSHSTLMIAT